MSLNLYSLCLSLFCLFSSAQSCPQGWHSYNNSKCFYYNSTTTTFVNNYVLCDQLNSTMVSIGSNMENNFLHNLVFVTMGSKRDVWLGGAQDHPKIPKYVWLNGDPFEFTLFHFTEPDCEDRLDCCALELQSSGKWFDVGCVYNGNVQLCQKVVKDEEGVTIGGEVKRVDEKFNDTSFRITRLEEEMDSEMASLKGQRKEFNDTFVNLKRLLLNLTRTQSASGQTSDQIKSLTSNMLQLNQSMDTLNAMNHNLTIQFNDLRAKSAYNFDRLSQNISIAQRKQNAIEEAEADVRDRVKTFQRTSGEVIDLKQQMDDLYRAVALRNTSVEEGHREAPETRKQIEEEKATVYGTFFMLGLSMVMFFMVTLLVSVFYLKFKSKKRLLDTTTNSMTLLTI